MSRVDKSGFNQFEIGRFQKRELYFWTLCFLLFIVGLSQSRIFERYFTLCNEHLIKYRLICLDRVLSDSFFILLFSVF